MRVVNGYPCQNCTEELLAQKGIDPAKAKKEAVAGPQGVGRDGKADRGPSAKQTEYGVNRPDPSRAVGSIVNLYA